MVDHGLRCSDGALHKVDELVVFDFDLEMDGRFYVKRIVPSYSNMILES